MTVKRVLVTQSYSKGNIFYIYRKNGVEIEVKVKNGMFTANKELNISERKYFEKITKK